MNIFQKIWTAFANFISTVHWTPKDILTDDETQHIRELLVDNYYIMLSRRTNHLTTYFIAISNFLLTGKMGYWAHAFMNAEDKVTDDSDFRIIEAIGKGVEYTPFAEVFDVQSVVLLKPKNMSVEHWTAVMDKAKTEIGKPYDTLFDLMDDNSLSCVELVRTALMAEPDYMTNFANFEAMIKKYKNLTPQMFYECEDFEVIYEIRRV